MWNFLWGFYKEKTSNTVKNINPTLIKFHDLLIIIYKIIIMLPKPILLVAFFLKAIIHVWCDINVVFL